VIVFRLTGSMKDGKGTRRKGSMHEACWDELSLDLAGLRGARGRQGVPA